MYVFVLEQRVTRLHQKAVAVGYVVAQLTVRGAAGLRGIAQLHLQVSDFGGSRDAWKQVAERPALVGNVQAVLIVVESHRFPAQTDGQLADREHVRVLHEGGDVGLLQLCE